MKNIKKLRKYDLIKSDHPIELICEDEFNNTLLREYKKAKGRHITFGTLYLNGKKTTCLKFIIFSYREKRTIYPHTLLDNPIKPKRSFKP